jgi:hypothetical protein
MQTVPTSARSTSDPGSSPDASIISSTASPSSSILAAVSTPPASFSELSPSQISLTITKTSQPIEPSATSSAYEQASPKPPALTPTLVTYSPSTTISSTFDLPLASSSSAVLYSSSLETLLPITTSRQESSASGLIDETSHFFMSTTITASSHLQLSAVPVISVFPTSTASQSQLSSSYPVIPTSETNSAILEETAALPSLNYTFSVGNSPVVHGTITTSALSTGVTASSAAPVENSSWASPTSSMAPGARTSSTTTSNAIISNTIISVSVSTISYISTSVLNTSSIATSHVSLTSSIHSTNSVALNTMMVETSFGGYASVLSTQRSSTRNPVGSEGWNTTSSTDVPELTKLISGVILPTGFVPSPDWTISHVPESSSGPDWKYPIASSRSVSNDTISPHTTTSMVGTISTMSSTPQVISTFFSPTFEITSVITVTVAHFPSGTATSSAPATPPLSPPLTVSQKAGVVIAGTTGLLIAVVAAVYIARRYRVNKARRSSTGSVYPKVAYLYDPPASQGGRDGDLEEALMSGGASGMPPQDDNFPGASNNHAGYSQRYSTSTLPIRFSDPGNPFRDPESTPRFSDGCIRSQGQAPTNPVAAFAAAIKGYRATSQDQVVTSHTIDGVPAAEEIGDIIKPSPTLNSYTNGDARSVSRRSILSEIASMAYNTNARSPPSASLQQPSSPYDYHLNHSHPCVRETAYTDSCGDPFEHDLLLRVDTRTETPDFATVYAPPAGSDLPFRATTPIRVQSRNPWASSMSGTVPARLKTPLDSRLEVVSPISPDATIVASERYSLIYDDYSSKTSIAPSQKQFQYTMSPVSPVTGAVHRGWDDIKRYSAEKVVPSVASLSPPLGYSSPLLQTKKTSLPQLRPKDTTFDGSDDFNPSSARFPLGLKIPFTHNRSSGMEAQKATGNTAHDPARGWNTEYVRSSDSTASHGVHSFTSLLQNKRSRDLEFACAGI